MKYIFDLDETLISSTALNNDAYNYALEKYGYRRVNTNDRVTRKNLEFISAMLLDKVISEKQRYFTSKWLPYRVILNNNLIDKMKRYGKNNCYLWTKASPHRVEPILKYCNLRRFFNKIIFDDKNSFQDSMLKLEATTHSNELIIYENNHKFFENESVKIIDLIRTKYFDVAGYLICL